MEHAIGRSFGSVAQPPHGKLRLPEEKSDEESTLICDHFAAISCEENVQLVPESELDCLNHLNGVTNVPPARSELS